MPMRYPLDESTPNGDVYKRQIYIPYAMGYGIKSFDSIPAYSTLIFEVELLGVA